MKSQSKVLITTLMKWPKQNACIILCEGNVGVELNIYGCNKIEEMITIAVKD